MINILNPAATTSSGQKNMEYTWKWFWTAVHDSCPIDARAHPEKNIARLHFQDLPFQSRNAKSLMPTAQQPLAACSKAKAWYHFRWNQKCRGHLLYVIYVLFAYYSPFRLFAQRVSRIACDPRKVEHYATSQIHQVGYKPHVICKTIWRSQVISLPNEPSMGFSKEPGGN